MKQKWLLTGTALMLAAALAGCGNAPEADQAVKISMEQAQTAALDAANIDAADAEVWVTGTSKPPHARLPALHNRANRCRS